MSTTYRSLACTHAYLHPHLGRSAIGRHRPFSYRNVRPLVIVTKVLPFCHGGTCTYQYDTSAFPRQPAPPAEVPLGMHWACRACPQATTHRTERLLTKQRVGRLALRPRRLARARACASCNISWTWAQVVCGYLCGRPGLVALACARRRVRRSRRSR